jgi:hypothetical protein
VCKHCRCWNDPILYLGTWTEDTVACPLVLCWCRLWRASQPAVVAPSLPRLLSTTSPGLPRRQWHLHTPALVTLPPVWSCWVTAPTASHRTWPRG